MLTHCGDGRVDDDHASAGRDAGTSIVFITHKLREVRAVADEITVIRRGRVVYVPSDSEVRWPRR